MRTTRFVDRFGLVLMTLALAGCASSVSRAPGDLSPFETEGGAWGFKDAAGRVVLEPKYQMAQTYTAGGLLAVVDDRGWACIDSAGTVLLRPLAVDNGPDDFSEGLARYVRDDGKIGFFDERGRIVIPAAFDHAEPFHEGLAGACEGCSAKREGEHGVLVGGSWGYIDRDGHWALAPRYQGAGEFSGGRARVKLEGAWVSIDKRGKVQEKSLP